MTVSLSGAIRSGRSVWHRWTDSTVAERKQILPYVDGLRGIAILMVITYHLAMQSGSSFKIHALGSLIGVGDRGVQLFFILSAFTLFTSSQKRFQTDRLPRVSFYVRRAFRILPFWWLMNLVWALQLHPSPLTLALSTTFMFGFVRFAGYELVPGGWSLFVEETFYVFLPLIFGYIKNIYRALGFVAILLVISEVWGRYAPHVHAFSNPNTNFVFFAPPSQWFAFGLGILLFFVISDERVKKHVLSSPKVFFLLDVAVVLATAGLLTRNYRTATLALFVLVFASIPAQTLFGKIARIRLLRRLGRYSYSLYLLHFVFLSALLPLRNWLWQAFHVTGASSELKLAVYVPVFIAIMLVVGFLSFNLIEKPCIDLGRRINAWLNHRRRLVPANAAELTAL